ncbi:unnamed protein product [Pedinophyceae sp. YPF-701]|nr:unnamed protein product [Pedinophyceae sp. YPF-701]
MGATAGMEAILQERIAALEGTLRESEREKSEMQGKLSSLAREASDARHAAETRGEELRRVTALYASCKDSLGGRLEGMTSDNAWLEQMVGRIQEELKVVKTSEAATSEREGALRGLLTRVQEELSYATRQFSIELSELKARFEGERRVLQESIDDSAAALRSAQADAAVLRTSGEHLQVEVATLRAQNSDLGAHVARLLATVEQVSKEGTEAQGGILADLSAANARAAAAERLVVQLREELIQARARHEGEVSSLHESGEQRCVAAERRVLELEHALEQATRADEVKRLRRELEAAQQRVSTAVGDLKSVTVEASEIKASFEEALDEMQQSFTASSRELETDARALCKAALSALIDGADALFSTLGVSGGLPQDVVGADSPPAPGGRSPAHAATLAALRRLAAFAQHVGAQMHTARDAAGDLRAALDASRGEAARLNDEGRELAEANGKLTSEADAQRKLAASLEEQLRSVRATLRDTAARAAKEQEGRESAEAAAAAAKEAAHAQGAQAATQRQRAESEGAARAKLEAKVEGLDRQIERMAGEARESEKRVAALQHSEALQRDKLEESTAAAARQTAELEAVSKDKVQAESRVGELSQEVDFLRRERAALESDRDGLAAELQATKAQLEGIKVEVAALHDSDRANAAAVAELRDTVASLERSLGEERSRSGALGVAAQAAKEHGVKLQAELAAAQERVREQGEGLRAAEQEAREAERRMRDKCCELEAAVGEGNRLKSQVSVLTQERDGLAESDRKHKAALADVTAQHARLQLQHEHLVEAKASVDARLAKLEEAAVEKETALATAKERCRHLTCQLEKVAQSALRMSQVVKAHVANPPGNPAHHLATSVIAASTCQDVAVDDRLPDVVHDASCRLEGLAREYGSRLHALLEQHAQLEATHAQTSEDLDAAKERVRAGEIALADAASARREVEGDLRRARDEVAACRGELAACAEARERLQGRFDAAQVQAERLACDNARLEHAVAAGVEERGRLVRAAEGAAVERDAMAKKVGALESGLAAARAEVAEKAVALREAARERDVALERLNEAREVLSQAKSDLTQAKEREARLADRVRALEAAEKEAAAAVAQAARGAARAAQRARSAAGDVAWAEVEDVRGDGVVEGVRALAKMAEAACGGAAAALEALRRRGEDLEGEVRGVSGELAEARTELATLREQERQSRESHAKLKEKLRTAKGLVEESTARIRELEDGVRGEQGAAEVLRREREAVGRALEGTEEELLVTQRRCAELEREAAKHAGKLEEVAQDRARVAAEFAQLKQHAEDVEVQLRDARGELEEQTRANVTLRHTAGLGGGAASADAGPSQPAGRAAGGGGAAARARYGADAEADVSAAARAQKERARAVASAFSVAREAAHKVDAARRREKAALKYALKGAQRTRESLTSRDRLLRLLQQDPPGDPVREPLTAPDTNALLRKELTVALERELMQSADDRTVRRARKELAEIRAAAEASLKGLAGK